MESPQNTPPFVSTNLTSPVRPNVKEGYKARYVGMTSVTQILLGCLAFILQLWDIGNKSEMSSIGAGIWSGTFFIVTGFMGLVAANQKTVCWLVTHLVMSSVASLPAIGLLVISGFGLEYYSNCDSHDMCNTDIKESNIHLNAVLVLVALIEGVVSVISSALACHGCCCSDLRVMRDTSPAHRSASKPTQYVQGPNGELLKVTGQQSYLVNTTAGQQLLIAGTAGGRYHILGVHFQSPAVSDAVSRPMSPADPAAELTQLPSYHTVTEQETQDDDRQPLMQQSAGNRNTDTDSITKLPTGGSMSEMNPQPISTTDSWTATSTPLPYRRDKMLDYL